MSVSSRFYVIFMMHWYCNPSNENV